MKNFSLDRNRIVQTINKFPKGDILVIGDLMLDEFIWGEVERISPEAPVPVVWVKKQTAMPGGAANVARNIRALGANSYLIGVIGNDTNGEKLIKLLEKSGINTTGIVKDHNRPTTIKTRVVAHNQQVVRIDNEVIDPINKKIENLIWHNINTLIEKVDAVIIEDYGKGVITESLLEKLIPLCHNRAKIITVDPKKNHFPYYYGVDAITPNRNELAEATKLAVRSIKDVDKAAKILMDKLKLKVLLVTLSEDGMKLYTQKKSYHIPTSAQEVYDVSGAGDTVIATFTLAKAVGEDAFYSAVISNFAAGIVVGKIGVATTNQSELINYIDRIMQWKEF